jgi:hypothetical protein
MLLAPKKHVKSLLPDKLESRIAYR